MVVLLKFCFLWIKENLRVVSQRVYFLLLFLYFMCMMWINITFGKRHCLCLVLHCYIIRLYVMGELIKSWFQTLSSYFYCGCCILSSFHFSRSTHQRYQHTNTKSSRNFEFFKYFKYFNYHCNHITFSFVFLLSNE